MMRAFITGTDTGVGKTFATALITAALRRAGYGTIALKPLCSGDRGDVEILQSAGGGEVTLDEINPVWLQTPVAPLVAARAEGKTISLAALAEWFAGITAEKSSYLVEGAGGWLVPITERETIADLAERFGLPVIPVVANRLGCINHTLLTLESIRARGLQCPGIILNQLAPAHDASLVSNRDILSNYTTILLEISPGQTGLSQGELEVLQGIY
jgi:dethiobiotin synthetase